MTEENIESVDAPARTEEVLTSVVPQSEKRLTQSEIDQLVASAKEKAYQAGLAAAQRDVAPVTREMPMTAQNDGLTAQQVEELLKTQFDKMQEAQQEKLAEAQHAQQIEQFKQSLLPKIASAKEAYPDFDEVTSQVNFLDEFPGLVELSNEYDNSGHMLYELAKNENKLAQVLALPPSVARRSLKKLSDSIKENSEASGVELPRDPISQVSASNVGSGNSPDSIEAFKSRILRLICSS